MSSSSPGSCSGHRSSSYSSRRATCNPASPEAQFAASAGALQPVRSSLNTQLAAARAAAASELATAQARVRQAAADHALLACTSPQAWEAAQAVTAAAGPGSSALLEQQLVQLDTLCKTLSDASSHMSEIMVEEAMARPRRASSSAAARRLSFLSRGSLLSLGSPTSSQPGSVSGVAFQ